MSQYGLFGEERDALQTLRHQWRDTIEHEGGHCPVCDRWGKVYPRAINRTMARSLIWLTQAKPVKDGWVDVPAQAPKWLVRSNQLPTLRWWGLVERMPHDSGEKKFSGMWRVTQSGHDFVDGKVTVPHKVFTYNGEVEGVSLETVKIHECFSSLFDYETTMRGTFGEMP